jgi:hypothetical protein
MEFGQFGAEKFNRGPKSTSTSPNRCCGASHDVVASVGDVGTGKNFAGSSGR